MVKHRLNALGTDERFRRTPGSPKSTGAPEKAEVNPPLLEILRPIPSQNRLPGWMILVDGWPPLHVAGLNLFQNYALFTKKHKRWPPERIRRELVVHAAASQINSLP
jgi:hypothetical protein